MKKPIVTTEYDMQIGFTNVETVQGYYFSDDEVTEAYEKMINALIEVHELLTVQHKFEDDENMQKVLSHNIEKIEKALTKAGVDL